MPESNKRVKILDPGREERRQWEAKRAGINPRRNRRAVMIFCRFCTTPISPDAIIVDRLDENSCSDCAKKPDEELLAILGM